MPQTNVRRSSVHPSHMRPPTQPSINNFGRISKSQPAVNHIKEAKLSENGGITPHTRDASQKATQCQTSAKRKHGEDHETTRDRPDILQNSSVAKKVKTASAHTRHTPTSATSPQQRSNPQNLPTPESTPTKPTSPRQSKLTPTKGQQRLYDIKSLVAGAQKVEAATLAPSVPESPSNRKANAVLSRSTSLYDRLKAKAAERANAPPPPSAEEVARRNALQRLPDVVRVLAMPPARKTQARGSHSLKALTERVQQSARSPMSPEEIERCLRLLVDEADTLKTTGFVRFSKAGTVTVVTIDARARPHELEKTVAGMTAS